MIRIFLKSCIFKYSIFIRIIKKLIFCDIFRFVVSIMKDKKHPYIRKSAFGGKSGGKHLTAKLLRSSNVFQKIESELTPY